MSVEGASSRMSETLELPRNRRRGLKSISTLLQIPLLGNRAGTGPIAVPTVGNLPTDILYELADHLHPSDLLGLSLTVRAFFHIPLILSINCRTVFICPRTLTTISIRNRGSKVQSRLQNSPYDVCQATQYLPLYSQDCCAPELLSRMAKGE